MKYKIWVLTDHRAGTSNQAIGLAEKLGQDFTIKKLYYNIFANLPNQILGAREFYINKDLSDDLAQPYPDVLISAGRRTAPLALSIKKKSPNTKIIQIMRPGFNYEQFDIIVLPQHDKSSGGANIYWTIGAMNRIKSSEMLAHAEEFRAHIPQVNLCNIAVMIGGGNKGFEFGASEAEEMSGIIENLANNHGAQIAMSFSRRTSNEAKQIFRKKFTEPHFIYEPEQGGYNPYNGMLATADFVIVTGDSISMASEVATIGKPLYIYCPKSLSSTKHQYFIQQLLDLNIARKLEGELDHLSDYQYQPLNEAQKIANIINSKIYKEQV